MKIKKYRPNFFVGYEDEIYDIHTKEDFFKSDLVKSWTEEQGFYRISYEQHSAEQLAIICELNEGNVCYIIALIHNKEDMDTLKEWLPESC